MRRRRIAGSNDLLRFERSRYLKLRTDSSAQERGRVSTELRWLFGTASGQQRSDS